MSNFGFSKLRVVNPYELAFREARSAVGAADVLRNAEEYGRLSEAIADCSLVLGTSGLAHRTPSLPIIRLDACTQLISGHPTRCALLFGSEKVGLSNEDMSVCQWLLNIPTARENFSMNLGQAVAVCLYELVREPRRATVLKQNEPATAAELERLTSILSEALVESGYTKTNASASTNEKVRRLTRRLTLTSRDAELLVGMLRKISRKE